MEQLALKLNKKTFFSQYWQKNPLYAQEAFAVTLPLFDKKFFLEKIVFEELLPSRLVLNEKELLEDDIMPSTLKDLHSSKTPYTLLVNDLDKLLEEEELKGLFDFFDDNIPSWRFDDLMISYSSKGGSVGAHTDHYDVFLLQLSGTKEWQIETTPRSLNDEEIKEGLDLKILKKFKADETHQLSKGDLLYLPAHLPHYGVATSDDSITLSIGFRSPKLEDVIALYTDLLLNEKEQELNSFNYLDKKSDNNNLAQQAASYQKIISNLVKEENDLFTRVHGRLITSHLRPINHIVRLAYHYNESNDKLYFFVNGSEFTFPQAGKKMLSFIEKLCEKKCLYQDDFVDLIKKEKKFAPIVTFLTEESP